ncbi:MAG: EAL domain-containing protein [Erythrobacter sp.]|uniref:putative bifunctional diguanylate cyclase/phosphodiesterase n=1 Tax=Erythrobacter sp. TaxID=1042 RepID=UPI00262E6145|nr:EAL domain-containing protein [Erythrobacter sp.]MDJ0977930.1 EAL domain-containing protein [Erythrobacter sp.]
MPLKGLLSSGSAKSAAKSSKWRFKTVPQTLSDAQKVMMLDQLEQSGLGWFWASDEEGHLTYLSPALAERLEIPLEDLIGKPLPDLFDPATNERSPKPLSLLLNTHKAFSGLAVQSVRRSDGAVLRLAGHPIFEGGKFSGFRGTGADITEDYHREQETERLARYDSLTGLSNRHRMAHIIETTLTAFKAAKRNCAVIMLDLDRFKQVNDTLGHAAGDELLKQVSARLKRAIGRDCEIGRLGGDEFQVLLPDMDDRGELGEIASKIITMLKQPYSLEEGRCVIGCSVGIAIAPHDGVTGAQIVRSADLALYAAKNGGRGQYRFFTADLEFEAIFRRRLSENLGDAVRDEQLALRFEPIVDAETKIVRSLETHICWQHPERGYIDEEEFAQILDGSDQVNEVSLWAINEACRLAANWPESVRIAVNIPLTLLKADNFLDDVAQALQESGLAPSRLDLEVGEDLFFGDSEAADRILGSLFKMGVRLTLDEFGSGYSSLAYLRRAPFDTIKIDQKLIAEIERVDARETGLVKAIVALAGALEMDTIATGIDTPELMAVIGDCGVGCVQGAIYAEPVDKETVETEFIGGAWTLPPGEDRTKRARRRTVFRKIQVIHDDHSYEVTLRNLSKTGALIEGLEDVPKGTQFVVDLGGGQLAVATVIRTNGDIQGLEFETALIEDGAGGLCTRNRVSPYALAAAGAPLAALSAGNYKAMQGGVAAKTGSVPQFGYSRTTTREIA